MSKVYSVAQCFFFAVDSFRFLEVKSSSATVAPPTMRLCSRIMGWSKLTHFKIIFRIPIKDNKFK